MAGSTTNLGLIKPLGSEKIRIAQLNQNFDTLDAAIGQVGSTSLQAQVGAIEDGIAIVANGDSHVAITAGQFVYVRNNTHNLTEGLYVASANVSANAAITSSNMTADASGGLNALNDNINEIKNAKELGTASSLSTLQTLLATEAALMPTNGVEPIEVYCNSAFETFRIARYIGQLRTNFNNGTRVDFTVTLTSGNGDAITIARLNGAWSYTDLNANKVDKDSRVIIDRNTSASLSDCDTITEPGMYRIISTTENRPSSVSYGTLIYFRTNDYHAQLAIATGGAFAVRGKGADDTWGTWKTVTTT